MKFPKWLKKKNVKYIGRGGQGWVYLIDSSTCIKIYKNAKLRRMEYLNLKKTQNYPLFPKMYKWGKTYIVREYIDGIKLNTYLETKPLTQSLTRQLIDLFETYKKLHFKRIDSQLQNIIVTPEGFVRPIDLVNVRSFRQPYPRKMMFELENMGQLSPFLRYVQEINEELYNKWKNRYKLYKQGITSK